jgi:hypothetical protein
MEEGVMQPGGMMAGMLRRLARITFMLLSALSLVRPA